LHPVAVVGFAVFGIQTLATQATDFIAHQPPLLGFRAIAFVELYGCAIA
jgi:hypothetical protein